MLGSRVDRVFRQRGCARASVTASRRLYDQTNARGNFCKSYANADTGATLPDIPALPLSVVAALANRRSSVGIGCTSESGKHFARIIGG